MALDRPVSVTVHIPTPASLPAVTEAVVAWQREGGPVQLHPGDLGWHWRLGTEVLAGDLRVWRCDGHILAVGLVDGSGLVRLAIAPSADQDDAFAAQLVADLSGLGRHGALPLDTRVVEARSGAALRRLLVEDGWVPDEAWTPLRRDLTSEVEDCGLTIEVVGTRNVQARVEVQRAAFPSSTFTTERWRAMAASAPYRRAVCLLGHDTRGHAVAAATVWSAGEGRPGLLEPLGVHRDHRGHGYGTALSVAAAAALREMGASSATVCTPTSNVAAVATYASAGFRRLADVTDFRRGS